MKDQIKFKDWSKIVDGFLFEGASSKRLNSFFVELFADVDPPSKSRFKKSSLTTIFYGSLGFDCPGPIIFFLFSVFLFLFKFSCKNSPMAVYFLIGSSL